ncbi:biofilm regulation diguanylate cyclase SiaD [Noviherbaspirillum agri]
MVHDDRQLEKGIEALLADPAYNGHPLRQALDDLYTEFRSLLHQIDRITHISDRYQHASREATLSLTERYQKQLRQLERIARISDRYQSMMRDLNEALKSASTTDALTNIGNRRMLMDALKAETARAERLGRPLTIALADVDRFKTVNDAYGHETGDKALIAIANAIKGSMRDYDICGRWGGEEFMIVMPEVRDVEGAVVIERIRGAISTMDIRMGDVPLHLSASFGIAQHRPGESISDTVNRADAALYIAKHSGRNRYEIAPLSAEAPGIA